jgi:lipopolysaccharide/colanic/teichoic acid biosynthesis glycosyltransferase
MKSIEADGAFGTGSTELFGTSRRRTAAKHVVVLPEKDKICQESAANGALLQRGNSAHGGFVNVTAAGPERITLITSDIVQNHFARPTNQVIRQDLDKAIAWAPASKPGSDRTRSSANYPQWPTWSQLPKDIFDITGALLACLLAAPLMLLVALLIFVQDFGPIFFAHRRIGKGGREFCCYKFRTMAAHSDKLLEDFLAKDPAAALEWQRLQKLRNDPRVTKLGKFLRVSSIDELPQLFNVLKGEMSLIGPRPIVHDECARYGRYMAHYCSVTPGLTGLWQVSGRNDTTYRRRVALDVYYARNVSFKLDVSVLLKTFPVIVLGRGCS